MGGQETASIDIRRHRWLSDLSIEAELKKKIWIREPDQLVWSKKSQLTPDGCQVTQLDLVQPCPYEN